MGEPVATFRSAFFPAWRMTTTLSSAVAAGGLALLGFVHGISVHLPQVLITAASAILTGLVLAAVIAYFRVYVTREGIKCYDFFGIYHLARWDSIEEARPINLLGLRYLRVFCTDTSRPLWVPLFLSDMSGFSETVSRHAEPNNPPAQPDRAGNSAVRSILALQPTGHVSPRSAARSFLLLRPRYERRCNYSSLLIGKYLACSPIAWGIPSAASGL